jgi:hypothetical protein
MYISRAVVVTAVRAVESPLVYSNLVPDENDRALIHSGNGSRKSNNPEAWAPVISFAPPDIQIYRCCEQYMDACRKTPAMLNRQAAHSALPKVLIFL